MMKSNAKKKSCRTARKFKLSPVFISLMGLFPLSQSFAGNIVVDPTQINGPGINATANGTPLIDIADPNNKGISHNKFTEFNASKPGVVFNNSMTDGVSQIGGYALNNSNLSKESSAIITEVTGSKSSHLQGTLEVFGSKADLIIANENGIVVNGISTINSQSLTLSTGKAQQQDDGHYLLSVDRGNVLIDSAGVSTEGLDYFDIVSRSATLQGSISGPAAIKVLTGNNDYDLSSREHAVRAAKGENTPAIAISGSSVGSMYGSRIQLISTESGAGVKHDGSIISASDIVISASGDISLAALKSERDITVTGENISTTSSGSIGGFNAERDIFISALNKLNVGADMVSNSGIIRIVADSLLQKAAKIQSKGLRTDITSIDINLSGDYTLTGQIQALDSNNNIISNAVITLQDGSYVVTVKGNKVAYSTIVSDVALNAKNGNVNINARSLSNQGGSLSADVGKLTFNVQDVISSNGIIQSTGNLALVSNSLLNNGLAYSSAAVSINVNDLTNAGAIKGKKRMSLTSANSVNNSGLIASDTAIDITATDSINQGKIHAADNINFNLKKSLSNKGAGEIISDNDIVVNNLDNTVVAVKNEGAAHIQANNLSLNGSSTLDNTDQSQILIADRLSMSRLQALSNGGLIQAAYITLTGNEKLSNDGQLIATDTLLIVSKSVINSSTLQAENTLTLTTGTLDNSGTVQSKGGMTVSAASLTNKEGASITASDDLILDVSSDLTNEASNIMAGGTLNIIGNANEKTLNISNSNGAEISAAALIIENVANLINSSSVIGSTANLIIKNVESIKNSLDEAKIQGRDVVISDVNNITNGGLIFANDKLALNNIKTLNNTSKISAADTVSTDSINTINNSGTVSSGSSVTISNSDELINSGEITSGNVKIDNINTLDNTYSIAAESDLEFKQVNKLTNSGLLYSANTISIQNIIDLINSSDSKSGSEAQIIADAGMVIKNITNLINAGDTAVINSFGLLNIVDVANIANSKRAIVSGDMGLVLDKIGTLLNSAAASVISQNGSVTVNAKSIENTGSYYEDVYNDEGKLVDRIDETSIFYAMDDLTLTADKITNSDEAYLFSENGSIDLTTDRLINDHAVISAANALNVHADKGTVTNSAGTMTADKIAITANLLENKDDGSLYAKTLNHFIVNSLDHSEGRISSSKDIIIDIEDDFAFGYRSISANENITINSAGNITNDKNEENYASFILNAKKDFINYSGGSLVTAKNLIITAKNFINESNTLLWSLGDLAVNVASGDFTNNSEGNIHSNKSMSLIARSLFNYAGYIQSGGDLLIDAKELVNKSSYNEVKWSLGQSNELSGMHQYKTSLIYVNEDYVFMTLPTWQSDIYIDQKASIKSGRDLKINSRGVFSNPKVTNTGGLLAASQDIYINGDLYNEPEYASMSLFEYMNTPFNVILQHDYYRALQSKHQRVQFSTLYAMLDYIFGNGKSPYSLDVSRGFHSSLINVSKSSNPFEEVMTRLFGETWRNKSRDEMQTLWSSAISSQDELIKQQMVYFLPMDQGAITAGRNFTHTGGSFNNGISDDIVKTNTVVDVEVGDKTVKALESNAQILVNQKVLAEIFMGISTLPTVGELNRIPGMFTHSTAFKKYISTGSVTGTVDATTAVGDHTLTIVPLYETTLTMIDKSSLYGSDYFFKQINYNSDTPVTVVGDSYYLTELINRQIETTLGSFFSYRNSLAGTGLVKHLMDNAALVADEMGLEVGVALSEDQRKNLDEDIIWYVEQQVDDYMVLVPTIYLSKTTQKQLDEGVPSSVVHANQDINIDASSVTSVNGLISAGKDANLTSEGNISVASTDVAGGIAAGGNLSVTSEEGDINVSGSYLRSGEDMSITAEKGDTTFTASIGTQSDGNKKLHTIDDSIQAGGNLKVTGENVTFNAIDVAAGGDAEITATDGDVEFNALSEIVSERSIDYSNDGLFSDTSVDKQSITATAVTSSVSAGGNLKVKSANDINIEGATFSAENGSFAAGNDVNVSTAQDVNWEKETTTKNEFVFSASASGGGHSAEMEASTVDGLQTGTSSGYDSVNQYGGGTTSRAKSNGAAATTPSAGFKAGMQSTTTTTEKSSVKNTNAQFDFANSGTFSADETVDIGGGDFTMEEMNVEANNIASTKYLDESKSTTETKQTFTGIKSESHSVIADVANKYAAMGEEGNDVNIGETTASAVGDATNLIFNDLAGGSLTIGFETTTSGESTYDAQENITSIDVGSLNIKSKNKTTLTGVDITAENVNVETGGDFTLESAKTYSQSDSYSSTKSGGLTVGAAAGATGAGVGASIDYAQYDEKANASSTTHTNSQMKAGNVNITTGGDMTLEGANIVADKADVDVAGDLNIISTQDTVNSTASSSQASASAGAAASTSGIIPTASAGYGQGSEYYDSTTVAQQSGITSTGEMNIQVGKDLNLTGGHILSDSADSSVNVDGDINATTLVDSIEQDGLYAGGSGGLDKKGNLMGSGYVTTVDEIHYKEDQKATISVGNINAGGNVNGQLNQDSSNMSEVTEDSYTAGSDISFTLGGNAKGKGKTKSKTENGNNSASATPETGSQSGSNSSSSHPVHDSPSNVPDTGHASAKDPSTGHSTEKTPANSTDKSTAKPDQVHQSPTKVPDVGHSSAKDPSTGNSTEKSPSNTDTAHESPTNVPDTGLSSATDPSLGDATQQSKPKRKVWALSPQGNLKGGGNVGTIKNGPKLDSIIEKWKNEYEKRNED